MEDKYYIAVDSGRFKLNFKGDESKALSLFCLMKDNLEDIPFEDEWLNQLQFFANILYPQIGDFNIGNPKGEVYELLCEHDNVYFTAMTSCWPKFIELFTEISNKLNIELSYKLFGSKSVIIESFINGETKTFYIGDHKL